MSGDTSLLDGIKKVGTQESKYSTFQAWNVAQSALHIKQMKRIYTPCPDPAWSLSHTHAPTPTFSHTSVCVDQQ